MKIVLVALFAMNAVTLGLVTVLFNKVQASTIQSVKSKYQICRAGIPRGEAVPNFSAEDFDGKTWNVSGESKKIRLVTLWATWCKPCVEEFPHLVKLQDKYKDKGLEILAINQDQEKEYNEVKDFMAKQKTNFPILKDPTGIAMKTFYMDGMPATLLVGAQGQLLHSNMGYGPEIQKELEASVAAAVNNLQ